GAQGLLRVLTTPRGARADALRPGPGSPARGPTACGAAGRGAGRSVRPPAVRPRARTRSGSPATPRLLWVGGRGGWLPERGVAAPRAGAGRSQPSSAPGGSGGGRACESGRRVFSESLSSRLRPAVGMARGNQRELARQKNMKKTQEISKGKRKEDSLTTSQRKQRDSEIMQQKQKIANEKKSMQTREK
ncbi:small EDRK-rich factor 1, partial [Onychomys torridus]|uniref:small EDRK-rich factor 1 n=1 Tax=Onychomys torridus TaxID=38674 RepID=UPI00167F8890